MENMFKRPRRADIYSPHSSSGIYLKIIATSDYYGQVQATEYWLVHDKALFSRPIMHFAKYRTSDIPIVCLCAISPLFRLAEISEYRSSCTKEFS